MATKKQLKTQQTKNPKRTADIVRFAAAYAFVCVIINTIVHYVAPSMVYPLANLEVISGAFVGYLYRNS